MSSKCSQLTCTAAPLRLRAGTIITAEVDVRRKASIGGLGYIKSTKSEASDLST